MFGLAHHVMRVRFSRLAVVEQRCAPLPSAHLYRQMWFGAAWRRSARIKPSALDSERLYGYLLAAIDRAVSGCA